MTTEKDIAYQITRYIPIFTIKSLCFVVITLKTYYEQYNVNILAYLKLDEVIFPTLKDLLVFTGIAGVLYFFSAPPYHLYHDTATKVSN